MERVIKPHDCRKNRKEQKVTAEAPYLFHDAGLPNAYLIGIKVFVCSRCERIAAEIPAVDELMNALARVLVQKTSPLTGKEVRFLRKRLGLKATELAAMLSVTPEQLSRWENEHNGMGGSIDRLIRLAYAFLSGDKKLKDLRIRVERQFQQWSTSIHGDAGGERIVAEYKPKAGEWIAEAESVAA